MPKKQFEAIMDGNLVERDDGGQALIAEFSNATDTMFVRLQSWDEKTQHEEFNQYRGRRVRITVETLV